MREWFSFLLFSVHLLSSFLLSLRYTHGFSHVMTLSSSISLMIFSIVCVSHTETHEREAFPAPLPVTFPFTLSFTLWLLQLPEREKIRGKEWKRRQEIEKGRISYRPLHVTAADSLLQRQTFPCWTTEERTEKREHFHYTSLKWLEIENVKGNLSHLFRCDVIFETIALTISDVIVPHSCSCPTAR